MQYPLISEYVRAIQDASSNLDKLAHLLPVQDDHGEPYRSSGAFAVVFKMKDEQTGKCYALKCFTEEQEGRAEAYRQIADELEFVDSSYITSVKYLDKEIFVDSSCEEDEFPVLLMDWIDGETMENYIAENYQDNYAMAMLCYRFCKMAAWLRSQPFAHGDIKPDNIMVRPDGTLTLVDYDGMFVPAMKGQKSPTIGTKDFSHPLRTVDDFDETIDDFALASIALSLKAISLKPSLLDEYGAADRLLFSAADYRDLSKSKVMTALQELMNDEKLATLLSMLLLANANKSLAMCSFRLFVGKKPELKIENLSTEVTEQDLENAVEDEYGVKYSRDGRRLLKVSNSLDGSYKIKENTKVICNDAFLGCTSLSCIVIPNSVTYIGDDAFSMTALSSVVIPNSVTSIGKGTFWNCTFLSSIVIPNSVTSIEKQAFDGCTSLSSIVIPDSVTNIGERAFSSCTSLSSIVIPDSVTDIGESAFSSCTSLSGVVIPNSVKSIGESAFSSCTSLSGIVIPNSVKSIGYRMFSSCTSLSSIVIPNSVTSIGDSAFWDCTSLFSIIIPDSVTSIGSCAFSNCSSLSNIVIPASVTNMDGNPFLYWNGILTVLSSSFFYANDVLIDNVKKTIIAFRNKESSYIIPNSITGIGPNAFSHCETLSNIFIPNSVTSIGDSAFWGCTSLFSIIIPDSVTSIGSCAFSNCSSLSNIVIPNSVTIIGFNTFYRCDSLSSADKDDIITRFGKNVFG